jgi:hypothetical protein
MSRRAAIFTETEIKRAIRMAQKCGAGSIEFRPDGTIYMTPSPPSTGTTAPPIEPPAKVVL